MSLFLRFLEILNLKLHKNCRSLLQFNLYIVYLFIASFSRLGTFTLKVTILLSFFFQATQQKKILKSTYIYFILFMLTITIFDITTNILCWLIVRVNIYNLSIYHTYVLTEEQSIFLIDIQINDFELNYFWLLWFIR